jgi:hypothetical protein
VLQPHAAPAIGSADELQRCVDRYAGWVTNDADANGLSRASLYAALAATGQCAEDHDYDGAMLSGPQCLLAHPELTEADCLAQVAGTRAFGIDALARALASEEAVAAHAHDVPLMGAWLGQGSVECGGTDAWGLAAPEGFVDAYVGAYDAAQAREKLVPNCAKRLIVTVALYTGLDTPGTAGVAEGNGCWTFERVTKDNAEWKLCQYDGTVYHPDGPNWAWDDTNPFHDSGTEVDGILDCQAGTTGRGYVYMANRGSGWYTRVTTGVDAHFAELYSRSTSSSRTRWSRTRRASASSASTTQPSSNRASPVATGCRSRVRRTRLVSAPRVITRNGPRTAGSRTQT